MRKKPPLIKLDYVDLSRLSGTDEFTITYPNGDTYDLTVEGTKLLLLGMGFNRRLIEKFLDFSWNTPSSRLERSTGKYYSTYDGGMEIFKSALGEHAWIIDRDHKE